MIWPVGFALLLLAVVALKYLRRGVQHCPECGARRPDEAPLCPQCGWIYAAPDENDDSDDDSDGDGPGSGSEWEPEVIGPEPDPDRRGR